MSKVRIFRRGAWYIMEIDGREVSTTYVTHGLNNELVRAQIEKVMIAGVDAIQDEEKRR